MDSPKVILDLPPELLRIIFTHIHPRDLMASVRFVCKMFHNIIVNRAWWMSRIQHEARVRVLPIEEEAESFNPAQSFAEMKAEEKRWDAWDIRERKTLQGHTGTVDSVKIFRHNSKPFCLSGSRDGSIRIWDLERVKNNVDATQCSCGHKRGAHSGWIWSIDTLKNEREFLTGSWDDYVKLWHIGESTVEGLASYQGSGAVTSVIYSTEGYCAASTYSRKTFLLDARNNLNVVAEYSFHRGPIFAMEAMDYYLYTAGEDNKVIMVDRRNVSSYVSSVEVPGCRIQWMSLGSNQLVCGSTKGKVLVMNPHLLKIVTHFNSAMKSIRQIKHTRGSIIAISRSREMSVYKPGAKPETRRVEDGFESELVRFDYLYGDLVMGDGSGSVSFWTCPDGCDY